MPLLVPREAVLLRERAEVGELGEAQGYAPADGLGGLEHRLRREEDYVLAIRVAPPALSTGPAEGATLCAPAAAGATLGAPAAAAWACALAAVPVGLSSGGAARAAGPASSPCTRRRSRACRP